MRLVRTIVTLCLAAIIVSGCTRKQILDIPPAPPVPITISDPVFMEWCLTAKDMEGNPRVDIDGDGVISDQEAARVEEIYLDNEGGEITGGQDVPGVRSLAGIEYFGNLRRLGVGNNSLTELDLSRNTRLVYLNCSDNSLASLDLAANTSLETLNCNGNRLTALDVSMLPTLKYLYCTSNRLTRLDVGDNPALVELSCDRNTLEAIDVGGCSALTDLSCAGNGLGSITLPENSALVRLDCGTNERNSVSRSNELKELDLAGQDKLSLLRANANPLTSLDISECASLRTLELVGCRLSSLDITANPRLRLLFCNDNPDGMTIYVPSGFDPSRMLSWVIGTATVVTK